MSRVIIQPAANKLAQLHYGNTIEKTVPLQRIAPLCSVELSKDLKKIYPTSEVRMWGVQGSDHPKTKNQDTWSQLEPDHAVIFSGEGVMLGTGVIARTTHNPELAKEIWGVDPDTDKTWEYIYFVTEYKPFLPSYPKKRFNKELGYKPDFRHQGFTFMGQGRAEHAKMLFALEGEVDYAPRLSDEEYKKIVYEDVLPNVGTKLAWVRVRKAQRRLRRQLLDGRSVAPCGMCGKEYPAKCLVAAHIKPYAECSKQEKADWRNVGMLMCLMGCDVAFEKRYISVEKGVIINTIHAKIATPAVRAYVSRLVGKKCHGYTFSMEKYFEYKRNKTR